MTLQEFFARYPKVALGFSGGVDSSFLLWAGLHGGAQVQAYYVRTAFQPAFEQEDAMRLAASLGAAPRVLDLDILSCREVTDNPPDRCYHCKKEIFGAIAAQAARDGYEVLIDGTNASDRAGDRPGMRALAQLHVLSPLRICGLTKAEIRRQSREAGLFTWDKPAYACLATRAAAGQPLTARALLRTEKAEDALRALGFRDFRVRHRGDDAVLEIAKSQQGLLHESWEAVAAILAREGYRKALVDMDWR